MKYKVLIFCLVALQCCNLPSSEKKAGMEMADSNGIDFFKKIQMIEFIFNVQKDTTATSARHWKWFPKSNEVVFITDSSTTKFRRNDTTTQAFKKLNARFTNDEYWLLFPFHLAWDNGLVLSDSSMKMAPISGKNLHKLSAKYNDKDGFTPGDRYEVYADDKNQIQEWEYHKTGSNEPSLITTWENYKEFSGIQIAQDHRSKDGKFHLWFTGIQIKNDR